MSLGRYVRQLRKQQHLTQKEVAERANIDRSYVSQIESGTVSNPSINVLQGLARALNTSIRDLLQEAGYWSSPTPLPPRLSLLIERVQAMPPHLQGIAIDALNDMVDSFYSLGERAALAAIAEEREKYRVEKESEPPENKGDT